MELARSFSNVLDDCVKLGVKNKLGFSALANVLQSVWLSSSALKGEAAHIVLECRLGHLNVLILPRRTSRPSMW